jgi:hypothetical protein
MPQSSVWPRPEWRKTGPDRHRSGIPPAIYLVWPLRRLWGRDKALSSDFRAARAEFPQIAVCRYCSVDSPRGGSSSSPT